MSPGGSTPSSSRSWPELPPLSNIVTTAFKCSQGLCFNPPSRLGSPVPPPKQPTFSSRRRIGHILYNAVMANSDAVQSLDRELREVFGARLQSFVIYGAHERAHASHDAHRHG